MNKPAILAFVLLLFSATIQSQEVIIPDANFKKALMFFGVDQDNDGKIQLSEALLIDSLYFTEASKITDMTGIDAFIYLKYLSCRGNKLNSLDVSKNTALSFLDCSCNQITALDVSSNTALTRFDCSVNKLNSIDAAGTPIPT